MTSGLHSNRNGADSGASGAVESRTESPRNNQSSYPRMSRAQKRRNIRGETPRTFLSNDEVTERNRLALEEAYVDTDHPAEAISEDAGQSTKAAQNWIAGENPMSLTAFVNAYQNNAAFRAWAKYHVLGEQDFDPVAHIQMANAVTNVAATAKRLGVHPQQIFEAVQFAMSSRGCGLSPQPGDSE